MIPIVCIGIAVRYPLSEFFSRTNGIRAIMWSVFRNDVACANQISHWHKNVLVPVHALQGVTHNGLFFLFYSWNKGTMLPSVYVQKISIDFFCNDTSVSMGSTNFLLLIHLTQFNKRFPTWIFTFTLQSIQETHATHHLYGISSEMTKLDFAWKISLRNTAQHFLGCFQLQFLAELL